MKSITKFNTVFFTAIFFIATLAGASTKINLFVPVTASAAAPVFETAHSVRVDTNAMQQLRAATNAQQLDLSLDGVHTVTLQLIPAPEVLGKIMWTAETDSGLVKRDPPDLTIFKGSVVGDSTSRVCIGIDPKEINGTVVTNGKSYSIAPEKNDPRDGKYCLVFQDSKRPESMGLITCATSDDAPMHAQLSAPSPNDGGATPQVSQYLLRMAVQTDFELFTTLGGDAAVRTYIGNLWAQITALYESEIGVQIDTMAAFMEETSNQPYLATDLQTELTQFQDDWNTNHTDVQRGAAALLSGKGCGATGMGGCGLAFLNTLCQQDYAYSCNQITGTNLSIDKIIVAHEIGHNFGAHHTHACWWIDQGIVTTPIDQCYTAEGSCFTSIVQSEGTLMSYCDQRDFTFGNIIGPWVKTNAQTIASGPGNCFIPSKKLNTATTLIDFGSITPGTQMDTTCSALLVNGGQQSISVTSMKITGLDSLHFSIVSGGGTFSIPAGATHTVKLRFICDSAVTHVAYLTIVHSAPNSPTSIELMGEGTAPQSSFLKISTADKTGDTLTWNTTQANSIRNVYLVNTGNTNLDVTEMTMTGADSAMFTIVSASSFLLPPISSDVDSTVQIKFSPTGGGVKHATLNVFTFGSKGSAPVILIGNVVSAVRDGMPLSADLQLEQNYPNPVDASVNAKATIIFSLPMQAATTLEVIDMYGRVVADVVRETLDAGRYESTLNARSLAAGTYLLRLKSGSTTLAKLMQIVH